MTIGKPTSQRWKTPALHCGFAFRQNSQIQGFAGAYIHESCTISICNSDPLIPRGRWRTATPPLPVSVKQKWRRAGRTIGRARGWTCVYPYYVPTAGHFYKIFRFGAMLPTHSLITFTLIQCSMNRREPGNAFAWITLTMGHMVAEYALIRHMWRIYAHKSDICGICGWCTSADVSAWPLANLNWKSMQAQISSTFYKVLQISVRPNILNAGGSRISNITFRCVMKAMRVSLHIFISLYFSAFLCISLHFSSFLCMSLHFSAFHGITLHFSTFLCISLNFFAFLCISLHFMF